MSLTPSTMDLALGARAPNFSLKDTNKNTVSLENFSGKPLLVVFMCNHCPYVVHVREKLAAFGKEFQEKGLGMVGINANDVENYPEDSPQKMKEEVKKAGYTFPYLYDETQGVAKEYKAACTPDFFLFDKNHKLVYRGRFDESRPGSGVPVTGNDLRAVVEAVLLGKSVSADTKPSMGCNIKWKPGNQPRYLK